MMSNVIAFPEPKPRRNHERVRKSGAKTLFIHIRRTTLIAHMTGRIALAPARDGRIGKN